MSMHKIAPGIQRSVYPLDYNANNPMEGFNQWAEYIRQENTKALYGHVVLTSLNVILLDMIYQSKQMDNLINQVNEIINSK